MARKASDHALALVTAGIAGVPVIGGPIATLIAHYVPSATERSLKLAVDELAMSLQELEGRIDPKMAQTDDFVELFKSCYLILVRTHQQEKRHAAVLLIANILLRDGDPEKLSYTELDHFVHCLDRLSIGAVQVLAHAVAIVHRNNSADLEHNSVSFNFEDLQREMSNMAYDLLMGLIGELDGENLLHRPNAPTIRTARYANYPIELTPIGARFALRFLTNSGA